MMVDVGRVVVGTGDTDLVPDLTAHASASTAWPHSRFCENEKGTKSHKDKMME